MLPPNGERAPSSGRGTERLPALAAAAAILLLLLPLLGAVALVLPALLLPLTAAVVLRTRPRARLLLGLVALAVGLGAGLAGVWLLRGAVIAGAVWVLVALVLLPLPLVPWLYHRTFDGEDS